MSSGSGRRPRRPGSAVLALQGAVEQHLRAFAELGHEARLVRRPADLAGVTHLVIPGGESTTLARLLRLHELWEIIEGRAREGSLALFGTCAGAILLAREEGEPPPRLDLIDVRADRNAYGSQLDSFIARISARLPARDGWEDRELEAVFIRAPRFGSPGRGVEVLGTLGDEPVLVRSGRLLASTFHPELTPERTLHRLFLEL